MKIAIHNSSSGFHRRWISYCEANNVDFKLVDCYANDLIDQLSDCKALMWHHSHNNPKDIVIAKQILFALEHTNFLVFPNFTTAWHFDDKVAQKYLFERIKAPMVPSYAFFEKKTALTWAAQTDYPKVFKLRRGAGSHNVKLVNTKADAIRLINTAFDKGFRIYDPLGGLKERYRKWRLGKTSFFDVIKGVLRIAKVPEYAKISGKEIGYAYFQDFVPGNNFDIRIIVIDNKAFGLKRYVRENDFRASGSGNLAYEKDNFDLRCVQIAFQVTNIIRSQCAAYDFVFDENKAPLLVEISYGFSAVGYDNCPGYWNENLNWVEGKFNPQGWMVDMVKKSI